MQELSCRPIHSISGYQLEERDVEKIRGGDAWSLRRGDGQRETRRGHLLRGMCWSTMNDQRGFRRHLRFLRQIMQERIALNYRRYVQCNPSRKALIAS